MKLWVICDSEGSIVGAYTTLDKAKEEVESWPDEGEEGYWKTFPSPDFLTFYIGDDYFLSLRRVEIDAPGNV